MQFKDANEGNKGFRKEDKANRCRSTMVILRFSLLKYKMRFIFEVFEKVNSQDACRKVCQSISFYVYIYKKQMLQETDVLFVFPNKLQICTFYIRVKKIQ